MTVVNRGPIDHSVEVDDEGHRTYTVDWLVGSYDTALGPGEVILSLLVPAVGSIYDTGFDVADTWAFALPGLGIRRHEAKQGEEGYWWAVTQKFTTKPVRSDRQRCNDTKIEDPLLEPQKVSGGFSRYTEEATVDYLGNAILNSSFELIRGQTVEFDANRPTIRIEQNVAALGLPVFAQMVDTLNDSVLWGLPHRCVKLSNVTWEKKYYGSCYPYYTRTLEFDVRYDTFDRVIQDEGSRVLNGDWTGSGGGWKVKPVISFVMTATFSAASTNLDVSGLLDANRVNFGKVTPGLGVSGLGIPPGSLVTGKTGGSVNIDTATDSAKTAVPLTFTLAANYHNPNHFIRLKDKNGENMRVILDGFGRPWDPGGSTTGTGDDSPGRVLVQKYGESNFLLLGIPTTF